MERTTLCYLERDGAYLMLHRVKKAQDANRGKWIGVGGKFLPGESPADCLCREVLEETGLTLLDYAYRGIVEFHSDSWPDEEMHLYTATGFTGALRPCDEGELAWVEKERVLTLPLWEGDRVFLRLLEEGRPFFRLGLFYRGEGLVRAVLDGEALAL